MYMTPWHNIENITNICSSISSWNSAMAKNTSSKFSTFIFQFHRAIPIQMLMYVHRYWTRWFFTMPPAFRMALWTNTQNTTAESRKTFHFKYYYGRNCACLFVRLHQQHKILPNLSICRTRDSKLETASVEVQKEKHV